MTDPTPATPIDSPHSLRTDQRSRPLGIDNPHPEFSWVLPEFRGQRSYEIVVSQEPLARAQREVWRSGTVESSAPFGVRYEGETLESMTRYTWSVRVAFSDGAFSDWSKPASFETGILSESLWTAQWISGPPASADDPRTLYFRCEVTLPARVVRGRAYTTALGWYGLHVNDHDLTGTALVPRWTPFDDYVEYQAYDVTAAFTAGENVIGMVVSEGRFRGRLGAFNKPRVYGDDLAAFAQIVLDLADGSRVVVTTDGEWQVGHGRVLTADPMWGERVDLRIPADDWLRPGGTVLDGTKARVLDERRMLVAEELPPVKDVATLDGHVSTSPSGVQLIDFGQNFSGVPRIRLKGKAGQRVKLYYSELLDTTGELATHYLGVKNEGEWFQRDEVILGLADETYQPSFTIHGFRYVAVHGPIERLSDADVCGVVLSSDLTQIGDFSCSDERLNRLWSNALWSLRSNFTDTATDCPTRERSGWTGDVQVFGPTASQLVDSQAYLRRYLRNVAAEQHDDGTVPPIIPAEESPGRAESRMRFASTSAGWGDVAVMLPWTLYDYYGDREVLARQYDSAKKWVDSLAHRAATKSGLRRRLGKRVGELEKYIVDTGFHWGEWLRPGEKLNVQLFGNFTGKRASVATAYLAHSARLLSQIATILENSEDAASYRRLAEQTAHAWRAAYVRRTGARIADDYQDDYVRGLAFDLLESHERTAAADRLAELIATNGDHLATGFLSTPLLLHTLVDTGHTDVAYRVLLQQTAPSWLAQIAKGATTVWETWEGYKRDGSPFMSHNHFAFGAVAQFLQERIGGLRPLEPGYRRMRLEPAFGGGITHARTRVDTPYGTAGMEWAAGEGALAIEATIPGGTEAELVLPGHTRTLSPGQHALTIPLDTDSPRR